MKVTCLEPPVIIEILQGKTASLVIESPETLERFLMNLRTSMNKSAQYFSLSDEMSEMDLPKACELVTTCLLYTSTGLVNASLYAYRPWCVEVAVWDALGKYANLPIYKMLGGSKGKVLAYASTGSLKSVEERIEDADRFIEEGFKMMKLRAHHDDPFEDVKIIGAIKAVSYTHLDVYKRQ